MQRVYENRYGRLVVESVSPLLPIRSIHSRDFSDDIFFDIDTAERIVLITENRAAQIGFTSFTAEGRGFLVVHESASEGYVARVVSLTYTGPERTSAEVAAKVWALCQAELSRSG